MNARGFACAVVVSILGGLPVGVLADALKMAGTPFEISVSEVSDRTVRVVLSPVDGDGKVNAGPSSTVLVDFPATEKLRVRDLAGVGDVQLNSLVVSMKSNPLTIAVHRKSDGKLVQEIVIDDADGAMTFHTEGPVYGLGGGREQFDRRGHLYDFRNGQNSLLSTNGATMPVPFLMGADGWGIFIHNPSSENRSIIGWGQFDLRGASADVIPTRGKFLPRLDTLATSPIQLFIMDLQKPSDGMEEYVRLTGHPVMPPKWVLGYMQSHRSLSGPDEPTQIVQTFRDHQLPLDAVIYLGSGYTNDQNGLSGWNLGHGSLEFNPRVFDQPQEMIDKLHNLHVKIILHENAVPPGLFGNSIYEQSADPLHISNFWLGHEGLMRMGIDGWWPDDGDELAVENRLARLRLYYEGSLKDRPNERPWSLDRNGYAGAGKYGAWIWSGDVTSRWETLANHVAVGLNFSVSVSPWWGSDTGGFFSSSEYTGELYTRWFEFSAFTPLFWSHGRNWHLHTPFGWDTGDAGPIESRPAPAEAELHNAAVEPICKKYLELRYSLLPYNYSIVREACDTGMPLMRALWLNYPDDPEAVKVRDEYLWGPEILVAPVVTRAATSRHLYLPAGDWYDWWTGLKVAGKQWIDRTVDLATMPIYVRAGAIVPIDPVRQYTSEPASGPTTLRVFPGADGAFTLYDDDGHSQEYLTDSDPQTQWIKFTYTEANKTLSIDPDARMKEFPVGSRKFEVQMVGADGAGKEIEFSGKHVQVSW